MRLRICDKKRGILRFLLGSMVLAAGLLSTYSAAQERVSYIDTHAHLLGRYLMRGVFESDYDRAAQTALAAIDRTGIGKILVMPPPFSPEQSYRYDYEELAEVVKKNPDRFAFLGGGGSLNPMIQESVASGKVARRLQSKFEEAANKIIRHGAVGFGEMTASHLSFADWHPYEEAPPNHPLFLLLADIAARHDVPIDLHMEALVNDIPLPAGFASPPNPKVLRENMKAFEQLLSHNRKAKIIWVHAGWDNTGHRTVALMRLLLETHPNLYMSIKISGPFPRQNHPLTPTGEIRAEWLELLRAFPDRFLIGSDVFHGIPGLTRPIPPPIDMIKRFLDALPPDLARQVGNENAVRLFKLK